jgi:glucans biosynthesis protein
MYQLTRRSAVQALIAAGAASSAAAQQQPGAPPLNPFRFEDVVRRARDLAAAPYEANLQPLPEPINRLDFDAYRDIRFRPERALLASGGGPFRMQMFHLGFLFTRPVTVNIIRDGVPAPVPYQPQLFDYGRTKIERPLPVNLGFAGFRLHYPLNDPRILDELIAFLGASYFRFLGRGERYGISARGLAVNVDGREPEEFPVFREFWVDVPAAGAERALVYALLDGPSIAGAFRFDIYPGSETVLDVAATVFTRKQISSVGIAPLTSMFFTGENDRHGAEDFRPELHDSDGLLVHTSTGEWIWRPLRNPSRKTVTDFADTGLRGFGLLQRDRVYESYQDLEAFYHRRPGYWIEPTGNWGEGRIELVEIPTPTETHDNIVAYWEPKNPYEAGQEISFGYRMRTVSSGDEMHPGGKVANTFTTVAKASGSPDAPDPTSRRFLIDFEGGNLPYYLSDPSLVQVVPTSSAGQILRTFVVPNEHIQGFRAAFDVKLEPGQSTDLRAFLKAGDKALSETWAYSWTAE